MNGGAAAMLRIACTSAALAFAPGARAQRRVVGVGSVGGGGVSYNVRPDLEPQRVAWGPQADFGTLELRFFLPGGGSIDAYSQLGNTLASGVLAAVPRASTAPGALWFASVGVLYDFNVSLGAGRTFLLLAPGVELAADVGLGGAYVDTQPVKAAVRVPVRVGFEWLTADHRVGLVAAVRAFYEPLGYARLREVAVVDQGFAALLELGVVFYATHSRGH